MSFDFYGKRLKIVGSNVEGDAYGSFLFDGFSSLVFWSNFSC